MISINIYLTGSLANGGVTVSDRFNKSNLGMELSPKTLITSHRDVPTVFRHGYEGEHIEQLLIHYT